MNGKFRHVDQFLAGFSTGDAISNEALIVRNHLRTLGYRSEIYCEQYTERDSEHVLPYRSYHARKQSIIIYHHSYQTEILGQLRSYPARKILVFHNVTPPGYVQPYNRRMAASLALAREELREMNDGFDASFAVSEFNSQLLARLGFRDVAVMPVPLDLPELPEGALPGHLRYLADGSINVLFVGRIVPNKRHQDLIKAFYFFRKLRPRSRLLLVGPFHPGARGYAAELHNTVRELGLSQHVIFTDMVPGEDLLYYYREARIFLSMSEHEGFFVPLLESMCYEVPVLAFASSVVPETLGRSGVMFTEKDYPRIAIAMERICAPGALRTAIIRGQLERWREFDLTKTLEILDSAIRGFE